MAKKIDLDEAILWLREVLAMTKEELAREAPFCHEIKTYGSKPERVAWAFERKFDPKAKDPTIALAHARSRKVAFSPHNRTGPGSL